MIELALVSSVLLGLTVGVTDLGLAIAKGNKAASAAAAGTAYGALSPAHYTDIDGMQNAAKADMGTITGSTATATQTCRCSIGGAAVTCPATCVTGSPETYIQVDVSIPYSSLSKLPWVTSLSTIRGHSVVRVE